MMIQKVKIIQGENIGELEDKINEFLTQYESKSIQLVTTVIQDFPTSIEKIVYTAVLKYFIFSSEAEIGLDYNEQLRKKLI